MNLVSFGEKKGKNREQKGESSIKVMILYKKNTNAY